MTGASLAPAFDRRGGPRPDRRGQRRGAALVAALAPVGPRLGVPSVIALRARPSGFAARARAGRAPLRHELRLDRRQQRHRRLRLRAAPGRAGLREGLGRGLGLLATAVVAAGPRAVGLADRVAVPLMAADGRAALVAVPARPADAPGRAGHGAMPCGAASTSSSAYQVSWILMFADYSRYTPSAGRGLWPSSSAWRSPASGSCRWGAGRARRRVAPTPAPCSRRWAWARLGRCCWRWPR